MNSEHDIGGMPFPPGGGSLNDTIENTERDAQPTASAASGETSTSVSAAAQAQAPTMPYTYRYGAETNIDDEVTAMLSASLQEIRCLKFKEFPTRGRKKEDQKLSRRAVPLPKAHVEKIMKAEVIIFTEVEKRNSQAHSPCRNRGDRCGDESGSCVRHPPAPAKLAGECGLLMGKASELLARELAVRSNAVASRQGKATIQRRHVQEAAAGDDMFDFLIDVLPRPSAVEEASRMVDNSERNSVSGSTQAQPTNANGPITVAQAAVQLEYLRQMLLMQQQPQSFQEMQPSQPQQNGQDGQDVTYI